MTGCSLIIFYLNQNIQLVICRRDTRGGTAVLYKTSAGMSRLWVFRRVCMVRHPSNIREFIFFFIFFSEETILDVWLVVTTAHGTGVPLPEAQEPLLVFSAHGHRHTLFQLLPEADLFSLRFPY